MFKRILVPTDGSESALVGARYAVALARRHGASLLGLHVVDVKMLEGPFLRDLSASLGTAPYVNYQNNIAMLLEERGKAALSAFQGICTAMNVPCETSLVSGIVPRAIVEAANLADLVIMGRGGEHNPWLEGFLGSTTEAVVRRTAQPVLVTGTDAPGNSRFLVAYDGSHHACAALKTAVAIASEWKMPFHVLMVGDPGLKNEAQAYLAAYEVHVEYALHTGDPAEQIVDYAKEIQADLLVMGAYGHTKVRAMVLGSTTAYATRLAPCPVLLVR